MVMPVIAQINTRVRGVFWDCISIILNSHDPHFHILLNFFMFPSFHNCAGPIMAMKKITSKVICFCLKVHLGPDRPSQIWPRRPPYHSPPGRGRDAVRQDSHHAQGELEEKT